MKGKTMKKQFDEIVLVIWNKDDFFPVLEEYTNGSEARRRLDELKLTHDVCEVTDNLLKDRVNSVSIVFEERKSPC